VLASAAAAGDIIDVFAINIGTFTGGVTITGTPTNGQIATWTGSTSLQGIAAPTTAGNVIFTADGSVWSSTQKIVQGTSQATTSGTSVTFTGIPSWVKRITVMFSGVSTGTTGTSNLLLQLGISSGIVNTGYAGAAALVGAATANSTSTAGILLTPSQGNLTVTQGAVTLSLLNTSTNVWVSTGALGSSDSPNMALSGFTKTLSGTLDRVRLTTVNGTDVFDAGTVNILYE
jgi:hypothetical protein